MTLNASREWLRSVLDFVLMQPQSTVSTLLDLLENDRAGVALRNLIHMKYVMLLMVDFILRLLSINNTSMCCF